MQGQLYSVDPDDKLFDHKNFDADDNVALLVSAHPGHNAGTRQHDNADRADIFYSDTPTCMWD